MFNGRIQNIDHGSNENTILFLTYSSNGHGKDFTMCMSYRTKQADRIIITYLIHGAESFLRS